MIRRSFSNFDSEKNKSRPASIPPVALTDRPTDRPTSRPTDPISSSQTDSAAGLGLGHKQTNKREDKIHISDSALASIEEQQPRAFRAHNFSHAATILISGHKIFLVNLARLRPGRCRCRGSADGWLWFLLFEICKKLERFVALEFCAEGLKVQTSGRILVAFCSGEFRGNFPPLFESSPQHLVENQSQSFCLLFTLKSTL